MKWGGTQAREGSWLCHLGLSQVGTSWKPTQSCSLVVREWGMYPPFPSVISGHSWGMGTQPDSLPKTAQGASMCDEQEFHVSHAPSLVPFCLPSSCHTVREAMHWCTWGRTRASLTTGSNVR